MTRERLPYLIIPIVALIAVLPLMVRGCSCGHDFDFHVVNWFEVAHQLRHGVLYPQWAATPAWNAGEPRFVFYPPASWFFGALLGLVMPWTWTPIAYTLIALTAAGLALYAAARDLGAASRGALLAAVVYMVNPYLLFTAYERTAYAELLAAAWLPLLLAGVLRERVTIPRIAGPVALLWLTNAPAAVMGCYALAVLALVRVVSVWRAEGHRTGLRFAATAGGGVLLGLGAAAIYVLPAAYERRWVQVKMVVVSGMNFADNFLFHRTGDVDHDVVLHTASVVALLMIALAALALFFAARRSKRTLHMSGLAILSGVVVFLLTPLSAMVWSHAPELAFLQFPWRLVAVLSAVFGLALAVALPSLQSRYVVIASLLAAALFTLPAYRVFRQQCDPEDTVSARLATFLSSNPGTDPTDEYTPNTADNDALAHDNPPWWLADDPNAPAPKGGRPGPAPRALDLMLDRPQTLVLNLRRYPAWNVRENNVRASLADRNDGLIATPLPAGPAHVRVAWLSGSDHTYGEVISVASFVLLVIVWRRGRAASRALEHLSSSTDVCERTKPASLRRAAH